ncbi:MAG TPA: VOC family protein [Gammaproteobacteria bacterium]|jgi:catechol 2,3-dioxygenase-like lactoylglutathione lyase family enzyme
MRASQLGVAVVSLGAVAAGVVSTGAARAEGESVGPALWMPSMNVFRRYSSADPEPIFSFYSDVLGHERLTEYDVGGATGVMRIRAGATELKFTGDTQDQHYESGGVDNATGLRLWTFFYSDRDALIARFENHGLPAPEFVPVGNTGRLSALVSDPEGELVQLIITGDPAGTTYDEVEVGLTVSDLGKSRAFYRDFVGLEELEPVYDPIFETMKYPYRHGATTISLRWFGADLPADTGTGGIQYVVSNVELVDRLAQEQKLEIKQPLSPLRGFNLRTIWLGDPDGITNYFAQTGQSGAAAQ